MKEIGKILLYLAATIFVGALLAPPLFWLGQHVAADFLHRGWIRLEHTGGEINPRGSFAFLLSDFQRYFNRAVLVSAFVLLWPLAQSLRIRGFREHLALRPNRKRWNDLLGGLLLALLTMTVLGGFLVMSDVYHLKDSIPWSRLAWLPLTAAVVAIIEECLFRGAIQGVIQRTATDEFALVCVALLFAAIHFLKPEENSIAPPDVTWWSGLALVPSAFWQFEQPRLLLCGFSTIFVVGLVLGYARCRTQSLWLPIGLHAGWILGKMSFSKITKRVADAWPWFGENMLVGLGPVLVLLATGVVVWFWLRDADTR